MAKIDLQVKGIPQLRQQFAKATGKSKAAFTAAIYQKALEIDADAVRRTPVDFGRLRSSHYVAPPRETASVPVAEIGFGTDYAVPVHERTEIAHNVGEAKFLEKAVRASRSGYTRDIQTKAKRNFERGIGVRGVSKTAPTRPNDPGRGE